MEKYWETPVKNGGLFYVVLLDNCVRIGQQSGSGHTDNGKTVTYKKFLDGVDQEIVREKFSESEFQEIMLAIKVQQSSL